VSLAYDTSRKRKSSGSASYLTKQRNWNKTKQILDSLTVEDLEKASSQSRKENTIEDSRIRTLLGSLSRAYASIPGSDDKKAQLLVQLKSLIVRHGCPVIFLTLNPSDNFSPLALFYAGEEIDLSSFQSDDFPYQDRARKLIGNPLAVVEYFHNTVRSIIEGPLKDGLFGEMQHHFGTIEYQNRGTPHIHLAVRISHSYLIVNLFSLDMDSWNYNTSYDESKGEKR
jgi:hypothetical protein